MDNKIDPCDTMRNNLIAEALGLQHCTKTAANVVELPGTDRVIAIGTPAEVARLLEIAPAALPKVQVADLAARCGIKATDEKLAEFAALVRDAEPVDTLVPVVEVAPEQVMSTDARECLKDVISHHDDFRSACGTRYLVDKEKLGADSASYWEHQQLVLDRMKEQAERALAAAPAGRAEATADLLDMLDRVDPFAMPQEQGRNCWFERLSRARAMQQPLPVPSGAVIIWRADLVWAVAELIQLRAYREHHRAKEGAAPADEAREAARYRKLRDAKKVPAEVWHALETGEGLDHAMHCWELDTTPIPFCQPCKEGRFTECEYVFPCRLPPYPVTQNLAGATDSEGGHHD